MSSSVLKPDKVVDETTTSYEVVLVTYHSRPHLEGLLEAVRPDQRLVVVDNASGADGVPGVVEQYAQGRYIDGHNIGFAAAANRGARTSQAEYLVFANPDSRPTPEIWEKLIENLRNDPELGAVAAATVGHTGQIEIGVGGWEPTPTRAVVHALGLHRLLPTAGVYARPAQNQQMDIGWLGGACLAVRRDVFLGLGGFDERYFVYNEDMAYGRAVRNSGLRQLLRTDLLVPHATGTSGGTGTKMPQQRGASMASYLHDHSGMASALLMRAAFVAGMLPRIIVAAVKGRKDLARQHVAYIKGIVTRKSPYSS